MPASPSSLIVSLPTALAVLPSRELAAGLPAALAGPHQAVAVFPQQATDRTVEPRPEASQSYVPSRQTKIVLARDVTDHLTQIRNASFGARHWDRSVLGQIRLSCPGTCWTLASQHMFDSGPFG